MTNPSTISDLRAALKVIEEKKRQIDEQHRALVTALQYFEGSDESPRPQSRQSRGLSVGLSEAIYKILSSEGPLDRGEIHNRLVKMGVRSKVGKATTISNVSDRLTKNPLFRNVGLGKWDLAEPPTRDKADELNVEQQSEPLPQHIWNSSNYDMRDAMASILAREGPLHRQEIHDRLVETGIRIGGRNPCQQRGSSPKP